MKNTGQIIRTNVSSGRFTPISNEILQSSILSPEEKSVLVHLLSLPTDWRIYKTEIWKSMNMGRDRFNKAWAGLGRLGYIVTTKLTGEKTNLRQGYNYVVSDMPVNQSSDLLDFSKPEIQSTRNPVSIQSNNNEQTNKEQKNNKHKRINNTGPDTGPDSGQDNSSMEIFAEVDNEFTFGAIPKREVDKQIPSDIVSTDPKITGLSELSIEELQDDYSSKAGELYKIKVQLISATYLGKQVLSLATKKDFPTLEQKLGKEKLEEIKPMIDQYLEQELISSQSWGNLSLALSRKT